MYISNPDKNSCFGTYRKYSRDLRTLMIIKFNHRVTDLEAIAQYTDRPNYHEFQGLEPWSREVQFQ